MVEGLKVLLIEDELALLDTYADILVTEGYDALKATDGYTGLEMLASYGTEIKLIFLDLIS